MTSLFRRTPVTWTYLALLTAVGLLLAAVTDPSGAVRAASTDLQNLGNGHVGTLVTSAFLTEDVPLWLLLVGIGTLLACAEVHWGSRRTLATFAIGHVGATLLVAAGLAVGVHLGWAPQSSVDVDDVGVSYGMAAVLGALTATVPARWRIPWATWWFGLALLAWASTTTFTAVGHLLAVSIGLVIAALRLRGEQPPRWDRAHLVLVTAGSTLGLAEIGWDSPWWLALPLVAAAAWWTRPRARGSALERPPVLVPQSIRG